MAATKTDFAQKLLTDLRQRKERMAAATSQNSGSSGFGHAGAYSNSRQVLRGSRERTRTLQSAGQKIGSRFKSPNAAHKSPATVQAANQIVPYGGGASNHTGELGDVSMALAYAFDNGGKLQRIDFTGSGKMMDFLQQIGRRSMQQSSNMQWPSANQFPTLTHLHVDEIAKGAQKLNQILRACSNRPNIDRGTVEIGKELWKGAIELEQSLRMLVSLQEASESMVSPRRKSQLKLLEEGEESEEDNNITSSKEKDKQVERPVFSFDKVSKNRKNNAQTSLQQSLMALTYLKEDPHVKAEKQAPMVVSTKPFHGRSASSPEFYNSHHTNPSKEKHDSGIPNVIAKLMGLEELSQKANPKAAEQGNFSKQKSGDTVTTRNTNPSPRGAEVKIEGKPSNKMAILDYHEPGMRHKTFKLTYDYNYGATAQSHITWNQEEGEGIKNNVIESKAVISKINELQNQIMQQNRASSIQKDVRKETRSISTQRKQQQVKDETDTRQTMTPMKIQRSRATDIAQAGRCGNWSHQTEKTTTNKPPHPQQKPKEQESIEAPPGPEAEGGNLKSEDRHHQRTISKSQLRKTEAQSRRLVNSQNAAGSEKKLKKQPVIKQPNSRKGNNAKPQGIIASATLLSSGQNKDPPGEGKAANSDAKQQNPSSTKGVAGPHKTENEVIKETDVKPAHVLARKVVNEIKPPKSSTLTKTRVVQKAKNLARAIKPQINLLEVSQTRESKSKPTQIVQEKADQGIQEPQEVDAENKATTNSLLTHQFQSQEQITELPPNKNSQNEEISEDSSTKYNREIVPDEVQEVRPQSTTMKTAMDIIKGNEDDLPLQPMLQRPTEIEKQQPLTEDELYLKQKLITNPIFLNTAEALFKLNIPIGILNYAIDQACQGRDSKLTLDCGYELLKRKGRRQEMFLHPGINTFISCRKVRSFDDLVRQLHRDIESLRSYGRHRTEECDEADYIIRMLERDIQCRDPDINFMWDLGWNELMFAHVEMDEVIRDMEHKILDELMNEMAQDYMLSTNLIAATA